MRLRTALEIYERTGPDSRDTGEVGMATGIVHAHLTPTEVQELSNAWARRGAGKGEFLGRLYAIRARLQKDGSL